MALDDEEFYSRQFPLPLEQVSPRRQALIRAHPYSPASDLPRSRTSPVEDLISNADVRSAMQVVSLVEVLRSLLYRLYWLDPILRRYQDSPFSLDLLEDLQVRRLGTPLHVCSPSP